MRLQRIYEEEFSILLHVDAVTHLVGALLLEAQDFA
jgi:hypothetical protein